VGQQHLTVLANQASRWREGILADDAIRLSCRHLVANPLRYPREWSDGDNDDDSGHRY